MELRKFKVLSFDCYGTLIDWDSGLKAQIQMIAPDIDPEELLGKYAVHEARIEHEDPTAPYRQVVAQAAKAMADEIGRPISMEQATAIGHSVGTWPPFPDSVDALARLKQHCTLVVLSNTDRQSFAGSSAQLGDPFDGVLLAEDIGSYKPSLKNFEALNTWLAEHGYSHDEHLHVAQSLFHDHVPGKACGWTTAWINRRNGMEGEGASGPMLDVTPDYEFPDMKSFADAMDASVAGS
ncbi:MAG: HAD-IA family hydrolase [Thermomicrobiales bacterium]|nr:HAD-IA family hydrolase [Thermomicrobiales bacterium]